LLVQEQFVWTSNAKFQSMVNDIVETKQLSKQLSKQLLTQSESKSSLASFSKSMNSNMIQTSQPSLSLSTQHVPSADSCVQSYSVPQIRQLAKQYYLTIVASCQELTVKYVASEIIKRLEDELMMNLTKKFVAGGSDVISELFWEDATIVQERTTLLKQIEKINETISIAEKYISMR
jgi:hypothetical protein